MAQNQLFEMPKQLRELAEKNVDQVRAAYDQFMDAIGQAWSTAPSNVLTSGFKDVQALAIRFERTQRLASRWPKNSLMPERFKA